MVASWMRAQSLWTVMHNLVSLGLCGLCGQIISPIWFLYLTGLKWSTCSTKIYYTYIICIPSLGLAADRQYHISTFFLGDSEKQTTFSREDS
jgi:hypothetical protein